jgi:fatty acid desaturase
MTSRPDLPVASRLDGPWWHRWEIPTWIVAVTIYTLWVLLVIWQSVIPWPLLALLGGYTLAWHGSLQHEAIHGWKSLPLRWRTAVVWLPIGGWIPYALYKRGHTIHHNDAAITFPGEDTETAYHRAADWRGYSRLWRRMLLINQTFLGRLAMGPLLRLRRLVLTETGLLRAGDRRNLAIWLRFFAALAAILLFVRWAGGMPVWKYYLLFVYPGLSLTMMRAFIEHRWGHNPAERIASVESNWVFGLLYLWNNIHIVHHLYPAMPWYEIPGFYRRHRAALLRHNGHYVFPGYFAIMRRWLFRPVFIPVHPTR